MIKSAMAGIVPGTTLPSVLQPVAINFVSGPGAGKSTLAAGTFYQMKIRGINAELVNEYAKDCVWRGAENILKDQVYIFGKQYNRMFRLTGQVDAIITDSPLCLNLHYGNNMGDHFETLVLDKWNSYRNITFFVERDKPYNPKGRMQTEEQARQIDKDLLALLDKWEIPFTRIKSTTAPEAIVNQILKEYPEIGA